MKTTSTTLAGVTLLSPPQFPDERGAFRPVFAQRLHADAGYDHPWAEMNLSHTEQGCIRGLHFQEPHAQAKLITVVSGTIYDVVVDLRKDSVTFGRWAAFTLSADNPEHPSQIYIPEGLAHGLATPDGPATIAYLVSKPWNPETEQVLNWNDPDLNIPWPIENPQLSARDQQGVPLENLYRI
ncbi:MAG: dTDP-4-dehydrorhamnose 3,5-epimerase [Akkermansiaceae bacterium]|nr:dTDP-4-dehydrorhamnose 3,5-epimerase [Akkermansiaceae bacterium]